MSPMIGITPSPCVARRTFFMPRDFIVRQDLRHRDDGHQVLGRWEPARGRGIWRGPRYRFAAQRKPRRMSSRGISASNTSRWCPRAL